MTAFLRATTPTPAPAAAATLKLTADWRQGKGVFGGAVAAAMARCAAAVAGQGGRSLRSFTVHFCAPATPGTARLRAAIAREGTLVAHARAEVENDDGLVAFASAVFAAPRGAPGGLAWASPPPLGPVAAFDDVPAVPIHLLGGPIFAQHFEYRFAGGEAPWSGAAQARMLTWIRPVDPVPLDDALAIALLDAGAPAFLARLDGPTTAATVDWRVQIPAPLPADIAPDTPFLLESQSDFFVDGYSEERSVLRAADGRVLALGQQLIARLG